MKEKFDIKGMSCASCQSHVEQAVKSINGIKYVNVNLLKNNMIVEYDESICSSEQIIKAVDKAGYEAILNGSSPSQIKAPKESHDLRDLIISIILLLLLMYISMGNMMFNFKIFNFLDHHMCPSGNALAQFMITIIICYIYRRYFINGYKKLFKGHPTMDSLIAIGATFSTLYGIIALFIILYSQSMIVNGLDQNNYYYNLMMQYHESLYFESAAMILTLVSIGKYLEGLSKKKTTAAITKLMNLSAKKAIILRDGKEEIVDAANIKIGDIIVAKKGSIIAVDGKIIEGKASIDQANLTGESVPVLKKIGDDVFAATVIKAGCIYIKAEKVGSDTTIENIIKLVDEASNSKAPISKLADKVSAVFIPIIFTIAVITFIVNFIVSKNFDLAFNFAITVIVIACPCALGLATPVAIMVGTGKGAENGLLIKNAEILEKASNIKTVVLDKTGTITYGFPHVTNLISYIDKQQLINIIYSIENNSEHPLASALVEFTKENKAVKLDIENYQSIDGEGVTCNIKNKKYYIGNTRYLIKNNISTVKFDKIILDSSQKGETPLIILENNSVIGVITLKDEVKETSKEAISLLMKKGIDVVMLTGDNKVCAKTIADEIGIKHVYSEVFPADKQTIIQKLKEKSKGLVAMVGDGVNDALALTTADLGISIGSGSEIAIESSDIVLLRNDLLDVLNVISLSKRVLNTIKINLFWAFFYNAICVFIATGILYYTPLKLKINPMYGSLAMSISSVSVVLNALTINLFKPKIIESNNSTNNKCEVNLCEQIELTKEITLRVDNMKCSHCTSMVESICKKDPNVLEATASLKDKNVVIKYKNEIDLETIINNINQANYKVIN